MLAISLLLAGLQASDAEAVKWLQAKAIPLKTVVAGNGLADMEPLRATLKDVQIVGMGECTHGSREVFQMKHRMLEFLVEKMGYRVFAIEASMPDCVGMDDFVMTGKGDPAHALAAQGFWTWDTEEVLDLLTWMRTYNEDPKHAEKLRVVGIDMQNRSGAAEFLGARLAKFGQRDEAFFHELAFGEITPELSEKLQTMIDGVRKRAGTEMGLLFDRVALVVKQARGAEKAGLVTQTMQGIAPFFMETLTGAEELLKKSSGISGDAQLGLDLLARGAKANVDPPAGGAKTMRAYAEAVRQYGADKKERLKYDRSAAILDYFALGEDNKEYFSVNCRDKSMADNLEWVAKTYLPGRKIMLWAHNYHVSNNRNNGALDSMGSHLTERFKAAYYPVGFAFYEGAFQAVGVGGGGLKEWKVKPGPTDSLEATLQKAGPETYFIDLGTAEGEAKTWIEAPHPMRSIGAVYSPDAAALYFQPIKPAEVFRGMIFIRKTTRARPMQ